MPEMNDPTTVIASVILSYADSLLEAKAFDAKSKARFSGTFVCLPAKAGDFQDAIEKAAMAAAVKKFGDKKGWKTPASRMRGLGKEPLVKAVSDFPKMDPGQVLPEGSIFVRAANDNMPVFTHPNGSQMTFEQAKSAISSGVRAVVKLRAFGYSHDAGDGVALSIDEVQPLRKMFDLGGRQTGSSLGAVSEEEMEEV